MSSEAILVVEDNDILRQGLQVLLETDGYMVMAAGNGEDALEKMQSSPPDLILSDISMPKMDGFTFFETVRAQPEWVSIPFIFLTARREHEDVLAGKKLGVEDYLLKPVSPDELLTTVRSRLSRSHQLLLVQLQQSYEASLIMLANAIEVRDPYTRGHVERVMNYSLVIAQQLGWTQSQIEQLRFGSILHDIGKIYVSEKTLRKEAPLSNEEWIEMRKHPSSGADLIKGVSYLYSAIPVILNHHERWDGSGYPSGIRGETIPMSARIVSVADSFDAITTHRPYRRLLLPEEAFQEILRGSRSQFDPAIVNAFKSAWIAQQIQAILDRFPGSNSHHT